ncbi:MAG: nickel-type superoxide dismutase maturation protease [bacterium]|nr:nickel-type superoxide dismutase maturation protease [bacterium]
MSNGIPLARPRDWIKLIFRRAYGMRVEGDSMVPSLRSGDRVLIDPKASLRPGDVVLARHPYKSSVRILKRLSSIEPDGRFYLSGDNLDGSTDSRTFGSISKADVVGKVVARLK